MVLRAQRLLLCCFVVAINMSSTGAFELRSGRILSPASGLSISFVECDGDGKHSDRPATIFIHGLDSSSHTWRGVQTSLETPSISIDCRGCGKSELGEPNEFSPDALVGDVKSIVNRRPLLQNNRFVLVGHSMGGRVAMSYAAKYPKDVAALVIEDMDIKRKSVTSNFIQNFNEVKAIAFERSHKTLDSIKNELEIIGYPQDMYLKWIDEGRIYKESDGKFYSDVNPAFRALCYRTIFDSNNGEESWSALAKHKQNGDDELKIYVMVAGIGTVCDEGCIEGMRSKIMSDSRLSIKTYPQGTHSIHNSVRDEFMSDLRGIINSAK